MWPRAAAPSVQPSKQGDVQKPRLYPDCEGWEGLSRNVALIFTRYVTSNYLYSLPNIVRVVKSRRMRWAGHVARMGEGRGVHRVLIGKPEGKNHWGDPDVDGRIILRWIFRKWEGVVGTGWSWLRIGTGGGHLWVREEHSGSKNTGNLLTSCRTS